MNCFQIIIFVSPETTCPGSTKGIPALWIAFKLLFLCRQKQQNSLFLAQYESCELLSNYYFCVARNNVASNDCSEPPVVNCFQIIIFVSPETTPERYWYQHQSCELLSNYYFCVARNNIINHKVKFYVLWIAFKLLFLCRQKQQFTKNGTHAKSCELLSNYYFCVARNNR